VYGLVFIVASVAFRAWRPADIASLMPLADRFPRVLGRLLPKVAAWTRRE